MGPVTVPATWKHPRPAGVVLVLLFLLVSSPALNAQRNNAVGIAIDVLGGGDDNPSLGALPLAFRSSGQMEPFYGVFPSVSLSVPGRRSSLGASYAYGWQRTASDRKIQSENHGASFSLTSSFSPRWNMSIRESFSVTDDAQTFYGLRGILPTPEGLAYVFSPVAADQTATSNTVNVGVDHRFNAKSSLAFGGSHNLRNYGSDGLSGLSNQQDFGANVSYTRRTSERTSWNLGYSASYYRFDEYSNALSHTLKIGMSNRFARDMTFGWSAGAARVESSFSYVASASLERTIERNLFRFSISQDAGSSSGLGSLSRNRTASLGFSRPVGRSIGLFASASVFDGKAILDNTFDSRGGSAAANIGFPLGRRFSVQVGAQYQRYTKPVIYQFTQRRLFVSLRYTHDNLFRF